MANGQWVRASAYMCDVNNSYKFYVHCALQAHLFGYFKLLIEKFSTDLSVLTSRI